MSIHSTHHLGALLHAAHHQGPPGSTATALHTISSRAPCGKAGAAGGCLPFDRKGWPVQRRSA